MTEKKGASPEAIMREIKRKTRRKFTAEEKIRIVLEGLRGERSINDLCRKEGIYPTMDYKWSKAFLEAGKRQLNGDTIREAGYDGLASRHRSRRQVWNRIPEWEKERVLEVAREHPEKSCREIACFMTVKLESFLSESSVYRILKAYDLITSPVFTVITAKDKFEHPTTRVNELWQTDFTYLTVVGWGWYYLSTVMDDFSRYIIAWQLCRTLTAEDVKHTLDMAIEKTGVEQVRTKTYHPMTQGKIERYHRSMKNLILLDHYYAPSELTERIREWVDYYNQQRYHEAIDNVTPVDKFYSRDHMVLERREKVRRETMRVTRELYRLATMESLPNDAS